MIYKPYKENMYMHKMKFRVKENPSFINVFRFNLTEPILKDLKNIVNPKHKFN